MEELIKRLERVIATGAPDKDGQHPISAEAVLEVVKQLSEHSTNLASLGTDCISRQAAIDATKKHYRAHDNDLLELIAFDIEQLPPIQPEPHWIPVDLENNEPQLEEWVLVSSDGYVMQDCIVERGGKKIWYHGGNIQSDDRYMPLPEPYKEVTT